MIQICQKTMKLTDSISLSNQNPILKTTQKAKKSKKINNFQLKTLNVLNGLNDNDSDVDRSLHATKLGGENDSRNNSRNRKASNTNDKDQIILKTLNLEERKRLIKQHQIKQTNSRSDEDFYFEDDEKKVEIILPNDNIDTDKNNQDIDCIKLDQDDELAVIEEEAIYDDARSLNSKIKTFENLKNSKLVSQSVTTLSSGHRFIDNNLQIPALPSINQKLKSPNMGQFKKAMYKSEVFKVIFKKIKEGIVKKSTPEYEKLIENLSKISNLSPSEVELCVDMSLQSRYSDRFQNPYNKNVSSSHETIEENIVSASLNHSFTYGGGTIQNIGKSVDFQSFQPSSGSSVWHAPLGFGNIVNGINSSFHGLGGSHKQKKENIDDFKKVQYIDSKSGNGSEKRSKYSKKSSSKKAGSESFTSGSGGLNPRRRLNNLRSTGSHMSNDQIIYKININKSQDSNSGSQVIQEQQNQKLNTNSDEKSKSDDKEGFNKRAPLHQNQQQNKGTTLEQVKLRNQSLQPRMTDALNIQKAQISDKPALIVQGQLIRWKELKKIGQGTQGEVFIAQNTSNLNFFVVKKLSLFTLNSGVDKEALMKLKKEIEVYRKLEHQNIIKYIGSEIVNNQFCIYLEYMSTGSLQSVYQSYGGLPEHTLKKFIKQILNGLIYLHENKVIHCDLKGANILLDHNGNVKLSDFGCSKLFESSFSMSDLNGAIRGSLPWMAPEVVMNQGIRRKADIWSLGCVMIELAIGGNPWGNQLSSNISAIFKLADPNSKPIMPENLGAECQDFINLCLIRDYEKRPTALQLQNHPWLKE